MMPQSAQKATRSLGVCCLATLLLSSVCFPAYAAKNRDFIVVMDISTSMADIFDKAKAEAKQFVSSAQLEDRVIVITFGKSSRLLDRTRVKSTFDIARILSEIDELQPTELSSNLTSGMEQGLAEMERSYGTDPGTERIMMWLSDEKSNPPKDIPNLITFETLKQREKARVPDHAWFAFHAPIQPKSESDVKWFVDWASRRKMQLKATLTTSDLGTLSPKETENEFNVRFEPDTMAVWGTSFSVVAEMRDKNRGAYSANVPVSPSTIICNGRPWDQRFRITFPERSGEYVCAISFVLPSDKSLEISPSQVSLKGSVQQELTPEEQEAEDAAIAEAALRNNPSAQLEDLVHSRLPLETALGSFRRQIVRDAKGQIKSGPPLSVVFGPIVEGGRYQQSISLTLSEDIPIDSIGLKTNLELPEGIELKSKYTMKEGQLVADISLLAWRLPPWAEDWEAKGAISFFSSVEGAEIRPAAVPARIYTRSETSLWGEDGFSLSATSGIIGRLFAFVRRHVVKTSEFLIVIMLLRLAYRLARRHLFRPTELVGTLEPIKDPTGGKIRYYNLSRMGKQKIANAITIGKSKKADIVLNRPTISEMHAEITAARTDAGAIVFIKPLNKNHVRINDVAYTCQKEINDKDVVTIGDCVFRYVRPEIYRETILNFVNGKSARGSLLSWSADTSSFEFVPRGAPSFDSKVVVNFSTLKAMSFVRKERPSSFERLRGLFTNGAGRPVEILFKDGQVLEGSMVSENGETSKRFYVVPKNSGETALMLVERAAVQAISMQEPIKKRLFRVGRMFGASNGQA
ncbi:VWA domain-containing protein [Candidatus Poribacteria bacterium]|nr:VWA domain-containing protein [Candidatus Poribacteria bacterium]